MGMAASQARFLGLTARMNNIEFEGQQINQQRTALSNKSASYYSDLLGMAVPTAPSVEEYTKTVYTFDDGALTNSITSLIADNENPGTYKVSYIKRWTDDFSIVSATPSIVTQVGNNYNIGATTLRTLGTIDTTQTVGDSIRINGTSYPVINDNGRYYYNGTEKVLKMVDCTADEINNFEYYLFNSTFTSAEQIYSNGAGGYTDENGNPKTVDENFLVICLYEEKGTADESVTLVQKNGSTYQKETYVDEPREIELTPAQLASITKYGAVGDDPYLSSLSGDQLGKLIEEEQAYLELLRQTYGDDANFFVRYIQNTTTGEYEPVFYNQDDVASAIYDERNNSLSFIPALTIGSSERVEEIKSVGGCQLEQDSTGRYINISIDGKKYALTTNTITDQDAYEDAMNQYEYDKALYDKSIDDINAKIAIIQAEDKDLELRLKQLDTEHNAVSNEKDAVEKVIQKAVEGGFKTFG